MSRYQQHNHKNDAGITDIMGTMMGLTMATTRFTWRQMQNAMGLCVGSQSAMNDIRDSMEHVCDAMSKHGDNMDMRSEDNGNNRSNTRSTEPQSAQDAFTGRKV
jgi:hypothetical protein